MSAELPSGWTEVTLSDHVYIAGRIGWRGLKADEYTPTGPILLSVPNLNYGDEVDFRKVNHISEIRYDESPEIHLRIGDTLLVKDGAGIGKLGFVATLPGLATVNSSLLVVRPDNSLLVHKYLFYYLKGPSLQSIASQRITGSATPHLFQKDIKTFRVLVPPTTEQHRIVAQLDAVIARVCSSQQRLESVSKILKRFRQAVLAAACSGKLTADWRIRNPDANVDDALIGIRRQRGDSRPVEIIPDHSAPDAEIPNSWQWVYFGTTIGELRNGISQKPEMAPPGVPILRISATRPGHVDLGDARFITDASAYVPQHQLRDGDLLFTRYNGSLDLLGVCGLVRGVGSGVLLYPDKLMRVRFDHPYVIPDYVELFFRTSGAHERVIAKAKSSAGQNGVSGNDIKAQPFALPPVEEQREIVKRVEGLFTFATRLETRLKNATAQVESLTQSILGKTFRGELVPTEAELAEAEDRDFESAEELLSRIRSKQREEVPRKRKPQR